MMKETDKNMESILLVDDQLANLQVLFHTLENLGCKLLIDKKRRGGPGDCPKNASGSDSVGHHDAGN